MTNQVGKGQLVRECAVPFARRTPSFSARVLSPVNGALTGKIRPNMRVFFFFKCRGGRQNSSKKGRPESQTHAVVHLHADTRPGCTRAKQSGSQSSSE